MKHAAKVIELMESFPGRDFRMREIVNYIQPGVCGIQRNAVVNQATRILFQLVDTGFVIMTVAKAKGSFALYQWRGGNGRR